MSTPKLVPLVWSSLDPNEPLAQPLLDEHGRILTPAGRVLTNDDRQRLRRRPVYIEPTQATQSASSQAATSAAAPAADEVVKIDPVVLKKTTAVLASFARERMGDEEPVFQERREFLRHAWNVRLILELDETTQGDHRERTIQATAEDLSVGGLCFSYPQFLNPGTRITVRFADRASVPPIHSIVRTCYKPTGEPHRIGCAFVPHEPAAQAA